MYSMWVHLCNNTVIYHQNSAYNYHVWNLRMEDLSVNQYFCKPEWHWHHSKAQKECRSAMVRWKCAQSLVVTSPQVVKPTTIISLCLQKGLQWVRWWQMKVNHMLQHCQFHYNMNVLRHSGLLCCCHINLFKLFLVLHAPWRDRNTLFLYKSRGI